MKRLLRIRRLSDKAFASLLFLFPRDFRGDFGDQMIEDFRDQQDDARRSNRPFAFLALWAGTLVGLLRQAPREHMEVLGREVQYAARLLRRSPGFTCVAVLTLALGIGTNAAIFSLADGMLFGPLPFRDPDRLVLIQGFSKRTGRPYNRVARVDFEQLRTHHSGFDTIATLANGTPFTWLATDGAESIAVTEGTPNLLALLGVQAHIGRSLRPGDEGMYPLPAMITYGAWQRRFAADPAIVGRTLAFDEGSVHIVGVLPQRFMYPLQGALTSGELLVAVEPPQEDAANPRAGVWTPVARLKSGVSLQQAQSEVDVLVRQSARQFPETVQDRVLRVAHLQFALFELWRPLLWLLLGAAGCVLLIACVNLAALLTARGAGRAREIAIRIAIGAGRGRLVKQLLVEALMLGALGGIVALLMSALTFRSLAATVPASYRLVPEGLSGRAMLFTTIVSMAAGILFGVFPALRLSGKDVNVSMRERPHTRAAADSLMRAGAPLVAMELALGLMLFSATGLMVNSLIRMRTTDLGFDPQGVVALPVPFPANRYPTSSAKYDFNERLLDAIRSLPSVQVAGGIEILQVGGYTPPRRVGKDAAQVGVWNVTPRYFEAIGVPLVEGRDFSDADVRENADVAIVSESVARAHWPGASPVGQLLEADGEPSLTVVGVVKDVRSGYGGRIIPSVYRPVSRDGFRWMTIVARGVGDAAALGVGMRTAAQRIDPRIVFARPGPLQSQLDSGISNRRFETMLFTVFGVLALLVAAIGVYGLMASWVGSRTREMGVRLALGADSGRLKRHVVRQVSIPLAAGIVSGLAGTFMLTRRLESLLFGITPQDPTTLAAAVGILIAVGVSAAYIPARSAARVDPMSALRAE